jgi:FtsH-binding integral membrane protein
MITSYDSLDPNQLFKVYFLISSGLLYNICILGLATANKNVERYILHTSSLAIVVCATMIVLLILAHGFKDKHPINGVLLGLLTTCQGYFFCLLYAALRNYSIENVVFATLFPLLGGTTGLVLYTYHNRETQRFLKLATLANVIGLLIDAVYCFLFGVHFYILVASGTVILILSYISYDTCRTSEKPSSVVETCISLYFDILHITK